MAKKFRAKFHKEPGGILVSEGMTHAKYMSRRTPAEKKKILAYEHEERIKARSERRKKSLKSLR